MTREYKKGFTIIELMLAMSFISVLLLAIAFTAIQVGKMYNRGMTLRSVNHSGRNIGDTLRRDFLQTDQRRITRPSSSDAVIWVSDGGERMSGRFCLGYHSYLWNTPKAIDEDINTGNAVVMGPDGKPISFVRVIDEGGSLCRLQADSTYPNQLNEAGRVTHLLKPKDKGDVILAVHSFSVRPIVWDSHAANSLYGLNFTIGTSKLGEINTTDQSCIPPSDGKSNIEFCAINNFDMIVRTNG